MFPTQDLHIREIVRLVTPQALKTGLPTTDASTATVVRSRNTVTRILRQPGSPAAGRRRPVFDS